MNIVVNTMFSGEDQQLVLDTRHIYLAMLRVGEVPGIVEWKYELRAFGAKWEIERDEYLRIKNIMLDENKGDRIWRTDQLD